MGQEFSNSSPVGLPTDTSKRVKRHAQPFGLTCLISQKFVRDVAAANPASD